jgi:hypothetical protein
VPAADYPTSLWQPGEIVLDWHDLVLPRSLIPGKYSIVLSARKGDGTETSGSKIVEIVIGDGTNESEGN